MYNKKLNLLKLFQVVLADEHLFRHDTWESLITHVTHPRLNAMRGCIRKTMKDGQGQEHPGLYNPTIYHRTSSNHTLFISRQESIS